MAKLQTILGSCPAAMAVSGAALAQSAAPITPTEVVGDWTLAITPTDRRDMSVTVESRDGGEPDFPLTISARAGGRLSCTVRDRPAECRLERGRLVVSSASRSGGARMIFTLTERTRGGFSGTARLSIRLLPIGGHVGSVSMVRR